MKILGIETSCDDTGVAIYDSEQGLLGHSLYSQTDLHDTYGGVVPELASRDHIRKVLPLIQNLLHQIDLNINQINGIAYTSGPGLLGALLVGVSVGRSLAYSLGIPSIGVHHMEGHLLAPMLEPNQPAYPFLALLVSGGHTLLVKVEKFGVYEILGESIDDAVGEAFDKTAKLMGLPYPGGVHIEKLALEGNPKAYSFPRPMTNRPGLDFSFSGLKTHTLTTYQKSNKSPQSKADIARAFQDAVIDTILIKIKRALDKTGLTNLVVAGGVSANKKLRASCEDLLASLDGKAYFPRHEFCMDNGAMIAYAGCQRLLHNQTEPLIIKARARWPLSSL